MEVAIVNKKLLRAVRKRIEINPSKFNWLFWFDSPEELGKLITSNEPCKILDESCGTTMCIAGWAVTLACPAHLRVADFMNTVNVSNMVVSESTVGMKLLFPELDYFNNDRLWEAYQHFLFLPWQHRDTNNRQLDGDHATPEQSREEALRRIDWVLDGKDISLYEMPRHIPAKGEIIDEDCDEDDDY